MKEIEESLWTIAGGILVGSTAIWAALPWDVAWWRVALGAFGVVAVLVVPLGQIIGSNAHFLASEIAELPARFARHPRPPE